MTEPLLSITDLRVALADNPALRPVDGVSFHIDSGESVALVGESGCGKSVTSYSVLGLLEGSLAAHGEMVFGGRRLDMSDRGSLASLRGTSIAMIPQDPGTSLNPVVSIERQLGDLVRIHHKLTKRVAAKRVRELLARVGIPAPDRVAGAFPFELSGGMRQRVLIAMALACEPTMLIADEPTTALDTTVQAQIMDLLHSLIADEGMSMMFISHDLGLVAQHCNRAYVMYAGKIVESGSVDNVLRKPEHPYTHAMVDCLESMNSGAGRLKTVRGIVPPLSERNHGCHFAPRCDRAGDECLSSSPGLERSGHNLAACLHPMTVSHQRVSASEVAR
ncbi:ABC transporter ATP-binding protein [Rhodococcus erythropolis]|uniref:ABC transporter ATP-binding protein n=1 Tax=Rhodococcus erythropolis TaxID=1833 RepID=UPI001BE73125|nr:ABC transporter ATP-binding protein [Rhodococcus erythropolis]MBT2268211.1 ABC transporter ATP-binding protein [Rhodococcus erythropolis]